MINKINHINLVNFKEFKENATYTRKKPAKDGNK
jgi:hypothetical protein